MPTSDLIAVTGATGHLGGRVAARLAERGAPLRLVVRDAARLPRIDGADVAVVPGYHDRAAMTEALRGAGTLLFVSGTESPDRVSRHYSAVDAAADAGVRHIVYTSFVGAGPDCAFTFGQDHFHTEERIKASGMTYTFLRDSLYQDYVPLFAGDDGVIAGPAGEGRCAFVARDDVADVAVEVLLDPAAHANTSYDMTGPEAVTMAEAAETLSAVSGREVRFKNQTLNDAYASRAHYGAPDFMLDGWVTAYVAIAVGELDVVSEDVQRILGRPPRALGDYLAEKQR